MEIKTLIRRAVAKTKPSIVNDIFITLNVRVSGVSHHSQVLFEQLIIPAA